MNKLENEAFFTLVENELAEGKRVRFCSKGHSMFPLLRSGRDEVILEKCLVNQLQPMDVVLFRYRGTHILHRIIRREGDRLTIQGDGVISSCEQCSVNEVIGKVVQIHRSSGEILSVNSWKWTLPSYLWLRSGWVKTYLLKMAYWMSRRILKEKQLG